MAIVPIVAVTGTKGKTTTVAVIADVLQKLGKNVLKVDTTGHFMNGERRSTLEESKATWDIVPTKAPGRYLWEFLAHPSLQEDGVAVFECSLGCSGQAGMGYQTHQVGVFLNVFEDHMGSRDDLQSREDIAYAKKFVFSQLSSQGSMAVFNADDELVVRMLREIDELDINPTKLPVGLEFSQFDIQKHYDEGGKAITFEAPDIVLRSKEGDTVLADLSKIPWTFDGKFTPSVWNLMSACGALYGYFNGELPNAFRETMESVRLDPYGGRLTVFKAQNGATIIADYAHEKQSLAMIADLARTQTQPGGKVIGVVRMAYDRTDELLKDVGVTVGKHFDTVIVYEKIDGYWRQPDPRNKRFPQAVGKISKIFYEAIKTVNDDSVRILREDEAIAHAAEIAQPEDVVVVIVNDNIQRSIEFVQQSFKADFV